MGYDRNEGLENHPDSSLGCLRTCWLQRRLGQCVWNLRKRLSGWFICSESACLQVCNTSDDCASSEACIENLCQRYDEYCSLSSDCEAGWYCLEGSCAPQTPLGQQCTADEACGSGHCVEGLCCDALCDADCMACTNALTGELTGSCAPVRAGLDPEDICTGPLSCNGAGSCFFGAKRERVAKRITNAFLASVKTVIARRHRVETHRYKLVKIAMMATRLMMATAVLKIALEMMFAAMASRNRFMRLAMTETPLTAITAPPIV